MFINEARISALLEHPNIVQVYDFGQVDGDYFLAMEYLRGRNLLTVGRRVRSLTREIAPELAAYVARETARGLHYAHTLTNAGKPLGIVHRDVSPSNIMLLRTGGVKLLDFGIARATMKLRANTPIGGLIKGKLSYLSPEQVRGQQVDGRSDVFSLGVVLWECLTGVRLFYNPNDLETMRNVLHRQVPKPSEMRHGSGRVAGPHRHAGAGARPGQALPRRRRDGRRAGRVPARGALLVRDAGAAAGRAVRRRGLGPRAAAAGRGIVERHRDQESAPPAARPPAAIRCSRRPDWTARARTTPRTATPRSAASTGCPRWPPASGAAA